MRVVVAAIPETSQTVAIQGDAEWARTAAGTALDAEPHRVGGELVLERDGARVAVTGRVAVAATKPCERCGEDVAVAIDAPVDLVYLPASAAAPASPEDDEDERDDPDDDLDVGFYEGDALDLRDVLCEVVALELPPKITCADVAACDARTAELLATKGASGTPGHPAFARLRGIG